MPKLSVHSQTARNEMRDEFGKFTDPQANHPVIPNSQTFLNPPVSSNPSFFSTIWTKLSRISLKKTISIMGLISLIATNGLSLTILEFFSPDSSPVFHRPIAHQGVLKTSGNGQYFLKLPDGVIYTLYLKPSLTLKNLKDLNEVVVKGNLT